MKTIQVSKKNEDVMKNFPFIFVCVLDGEIDCIGDMSFVGFIDGNSKQHMPEQKLYIDYACGWIRCDLFIPIDISQWESFNEFLVALKENRAVLTLDSQEHFYPEIKNANWDSLIDEMVEFLAEN